MGFQNGQAVFLGDGQEVEYIAGHTGEHVVRAILNAEDEEPRYGRPLTVYEVFAEAPVAKYNDQVVKAREELAAIKAALTAAREEKRQLETEAKARAASFARHRALDRLEDFVEGRITHVVVESTYNASIQTFEQAFTDTDHRGRVDGIKLVSLLGRSNGDLTWNVNRYYDGSGSNTTIHPARSFEEAKEIWLGVFEHAMAEYRAKTGYMHGFNYWIESAALAGADVPADLAERWYQGSVESAETNLTKAREQLALNETALTQAKAKLDAVTSTNP